MLSQKQKNPLLAGLAPGAFNDQPPAVAEEKKTCPILQTAGLTKHYQMGEVTVKALQEVDLTVEKGEFVAIMGPSGSGKSTLLHLMGGLDTPTAGEVFLAGRPLSKLSDHELARVRRQKIGFIFQFYNLLPTLTVMENIALPLLIDGQPLRGSRQHHQWRG